MLQRLGIRGKILAVVAVPIIVLLLASGYITLAAVNALGNATNAQQLVATDKATQPFQAAFNVERDAAANFVDTFTSYSSARANAQSAIDVSIEALKTTDTPAYNAVEDAFNGGQATESGGTAQSLDQARAVGPYQEGEEDLSAEDAAKNDTGDWWTWPATDTVNSSVESVLAISDAVDELAGKASGTTKDTLRDIAFQLDQEAAAAQSLLTVPQTYQQAFIDSTEESDNTWGGLLSKMNGVKKSESNDAMIAMISTAKDQMRDLQSTRTKVRLAGNSASNLSSWYYGVLGSLNDMIDRSSIAVNDPDLSLDLSAFGATYNVQQQLSLESTSTQRILRQGDYKQGDATGARNQIAATDFALEQAQSAVDAIGGTIAVPDWGASKTTTSNLDFLSIRNTVAAGDAAALATIANQDWVGMVQAEADAQKPAYDETISMATVRADALRQTALLQTVATALGAAVAVALSLIVALLISRRIVVPLRRLTTTATAVRAELPRLVERVAMPGETVDVAEVQIPVESRDEIGRLAEAFNGVNAATLSIAGEQAALRGSISEMFVNVARRDQVLLNRQLASIDDMERTQDDPETLTKLFALDHLATRMRRNSESLLVLAGIDTGRRLRRSMPLSDVIRTASSEIELYERVQLELDADPAMLGHSALTAAHLFAELLENATVFSDPGTPVVVRTSEHEGQYIVEVQDSGIGMSESELAEANSRVASTAASEILGAQRLGLFVVGRIARRIGARVSIESTEGQGTTARVVMNPSLFDSTVAPDMVHHTESTVDEAMHAPAALVTNNSEDEQFEAPAPATAEPAYQPSVVEAAPLAVREPSSQPTVDELIAADASAAPAGVAVDSADLTDGVTGMGLPTRRRRTGPVEVSEDEAKNVIGLPARATAAQLSALEAATPGEEFKPAIPASEITPQTPEERAQMFRGFRSRRDLTGQETPLDAEAESLGHAARRGGLAPEDVVAAQQPEPLVIPSLEDDEFEETPAAAAEVVEVAEVALAAEITEFEDTPALTADEPPARIGTAGFGYDDQPESAVPMPMVVPLLEDDDEDFPVAEPAAVSDAAESVELAEQPVAEEPVAEEIAGVEPEPEPEFVTSESPADQGIGAAPVVAAAAAAAPFSYADVYGSLPASAPTPEPQQAWAAEVAQVEPASALAGEGSTEPTLDELIAGSSGEAAAKAGFFGRLFRKNKAAKEAPAPREKAPKKLSKKEQRAAEAAEAAAAAAAAAIAAQAIEPDGGAGFAPTPQPSVPAPAFATAPAYDAAPAYEAAPAYGSAPAYEAAPAYDSAPTYEAAPVYEAPAPAYEAPAPAYEAPAPAYEAAPAPAVPTFDSPAMVQAPAVQAPEAVSPGGAFALWSSQTPAPVAEPQADPHTFEVPTAGQAFSVDELANPFGWEAAGASALLAAEPEVAVEYQPVVDLQPELDSEHAGQAEVTSSVFSELSSLAAERPKVDTTRAGLQRRRAADAPAVQVKPIESEVQLSHKERDADEVRDRFSSFYSGTQRARHDVAEFEQRSQSTAGKE